jgi:hypothetical protein
VVNFTVESDLALVAELYSIDVEGAVVLNFPTRLSVDVVAPDLYPAVVDESVENKINEFTLFVVETCILCFNDICSSVLY